MEKTCTICQTTKPLDAFKKDIKSKGGYRNQCVSCCNFGKRKWHAREHVKEKRAAYTARQETKTANMEGILRRIYGITLAEYQQIFTNQNGNCAICGKQNGKGADKLCVDHCHATGKVRGLLCTRCNTALGLFKDNLQSLANAHSYLKASQATDATA